MNKTLYDKLKEDFPDILESVYPACGDGWEPIIRECCAKLSDARKRFMAENEIDDYTETCGQASQIKEKYGGLRFYLMSGTEEMHKATEEAEERSLTICEDCGADGKLRPGGWYRTLCDKCHGK